MLVYICLLLFWPASTTSSSSADADAVGSLAGKWKLKAAYEEQYTVAVTDVWQERSGGEIHWSVLCGPGPCTSWQTAAFISYTTNASIKVDFHNGYRDTGTYSSGEIVWKSGSSWCVRAPPHRRTATATATATTTATATVCTHPHIRIGTAC